MKKEFVRAAGNQIRKELRGGMRSRYMPKSPMPAMSAVGDDGDGQPGAIHIHIGTQPTDRLDAQDRRSTEARDPEKDNTPLNGGMENSPADKETSAEGGPSDRKKDILQALMGMRKKK